MTRKQARRRKQKKTQRLRMPVLPLRGLSVALMAVALVTLSYRFSAGLFDQPITSITIDGPFERVTALQIEEAVGDELNAGFFTANLEAIRERIAALPWIDEASVARRWPGTLVVSVTEQVPAAIWGENGLLNTRGELFVLDARRVPAELPRLRGPAGQASVVAARYLEMRENLIPTGLDLQQVTLDARGAWAMKLRSGIDIRLGRRDVDVRARLFVDAAASLIAAREDEIEFVDMRYSNGFTIGWKNASYSPLRSTASDDDGMLARLGN